MMSLKSSPMAAHRGSIRRIVLTLSIAFCALAFSLNDRSDVHARPNPKGKKTTEAPQNFLRQTNTYSNIEFFFSNRGVLFNSGQNAEGLFLPRGSKDRKSTRL